MRIAVTYENGQVFQHFGHTEQFKVYEVEDGKVVSSEIIGSDGQGHGALAGLLSNKSIDVEPKQLLANRGLSFVQEHQVMLMLQLRHTLKVSLLTQE